MVGQTRVKWAHVERYWIRRGSAGFEIRRKGGDAILIAPSAAGSHFLTHIVGHNFSNSAGCEIPNGHLSAIKRKFGVTRNQLLAE